MAGPPKKKQHAVSIIRQCAFAQLREEHFFYEAQTLERLLESMKELLRDGLETQYVIPSYVCPRTNPIAERKRERKRKQKPKPARPSSSSQPKSATSSTTSP